MDIYASNYPFGREDQAPRKLLQESGFEYAINELGRKLKPEELLEKAGSCKALIAGTENLEPLIKFNPSLKMISRIGIGLDSVPLQLCKERGIQVSYTPDAVTMAVVELTLGLMISLPRQVVRADRELRAGNWTRFYGPRLEGMNIAIVGCGRIGSRVAKLLSSFKPARLFLVDLLDKSNLVAELISAGCTSSQVSLEEALSQAQMVSLHIPGHRRNQDLINAESLQTMPQGGYLINTARGGIVNEAALELALGSGQMAGAALDVFTEEPYKGPLTNLENVIITQHMGSCSIDCRARMEREATEEVLRFIKGEPLQQAVPRAEYQAQA
jgi:D-3-phosphoglycerate dehydrogenase / 2-oxoglutarate reductase